MFKGSDFKIIKTNICSSQLCIIFVGFLETLENLFWLQARYLHRQKKGRCNQIVFFNENMLNLISFNTIFIKWKYLRQPSFSGPLHTPKMDRMEWIFKVMLQYLRLKREKRRGVTLKVWNQRFLNLTIPI